VARGGGRMSICRSAACDVLYKAHCQAQSSDPGREPVRDSSRVFAAAATLAGVGGVDQGGGRGQRVRERGGAALCRRRRVGVSRCFHREEMFLPPPRGLRLCTGYRVHCQNRVQVEFRYWR